mmetsp:Transcript_26738/g.75092  ORF Transcript_26738/g.75092 Transcript_26738/m.75092 type:complete len:373 (-) Transcript_26738:955-2073(-)
MYPSPFRGRNFSSLPPSLLSQQERGRRQGRKTIQQQLSPIGPPAAMGASLTTSAVAAHSSSPPSLRSCSTVWNSSVCWTVVSRSCQCSMKRRASVAEMRSLFCSSAVIRSSCPFICTASLSCWEPCTAASCKGSIAPASAWGESWCCGGRRRPPTLAEGKGAPELHGVPLQTSPGLPSRPLPPLPGAPSHSAAGSAICLGSVPWPCGRPFKLRARLSVLLESSTTPGLGSLSMIVGLFGKAEEESRRGLGCFGDSLPRPPAGTLPSAGAAAVSTDWREWSSRSGHGSPGQQITSPAKHSCFSLDPSSMYSTWHNPVPWLKPVTLAANHVLMPGQYTMSSGWSSCSPALCCWWSFSCSCRERLQSHCPIGRLC